MAEDKAKGPEGADEDLIDGVDAALEVDDPTDEVDADDESSSEPAEEVDVEEIDDEEDEDEEDEDLADEEDSPRSGKSIPDYSTAPAKKNRPTRSRAEATQAAAPKKTGPGDFIGQVVQELKKVSWPTGSQLMQYFLVVLGFVVFMIAFIGLLDVLFGWLMLKLFS